MNETRLYLFMILTALAMFGLAGPVESLRAQDDAAQTTNEQTANGQTANGQDDSADAAGGQDSQTPTSPPTGGMDNIGLVAMCSIVIAGLTIAIGSIGPAFGEGRAVAQALTSIAQQPDSSNTITRTLFVGLAMIESTAIYCFVVSMILLFANPFWDHFIK